MDLSKPSTFESVYTEHSRGVYAAAYRILNNAAQAQDVTQDVFMRIWRNPHRFDSRRGELGSYLRLMGRSRALDLWREGQAAGRAGDRLKVVAAREEGRVEDRPRPPASGPTPASTCATRSASSRRPSARRSCSPTGAGSPPTRSPRGPHVPLGTAKSRIRLGLAKLREQCGPALDIAA